MPATLVLIAIVVLIAAAFVGLNWRMFSFLFELAHAEPAYAKEMPPEMIGLMFGLVGSIFLFMFPIYFAIAAYEAACLRWMIRGEAPGLFGLTFDNDVWRVYGVYWCWLIAHWVVSMVAGVVAMPLMFATMGEVFANPQDTDAIWRWQMRVQVPITLITYIPLIFVGVRFGPAAATSVARRRFSFLEAWTVTRGRFWELLGSFAILWLIWFAATLASTWPLIARLWPHWAAMFTAAPTEESIQAYVDTFMTPETWLWAGVGYTVMGVAGIWLAIMNFGVNARAALAALEQGKIKQEPA